VSMSALWRWTFGLGIAALVTVVPVVYFRYTYTHSKRLREVTSGRVYRSGQMTVEGFTDAVARYHLRTIINFQDELPDPEIRRSFLDGSSVPESELCRRLGVRYVYLPPDLILRRRIPHDRPLAVDRFLALMDDPSTYPVLLHCRAGLHRTGVMTAVYRMEYDGWTPAEAIRELKANGFGYLACTSANDYITQYILNYRRGIRVRPEAEGIGE